MSTPPDPPPAAPDPPAPAVPVGPVEAGEPAPNGAMGLDLNFGMLEQLISTNRRAAWMPSPPAAPPAPPPAPEADATAEHLGELADDMLDLLRRVKGLEATQADVIARLERIETTARDGARMQARETDNIRRELLGEHSALAARATAEAVFPVLDKLRPMRAAINPRKNEVLANQLDAVLEILAGMLRAFGFVPFEPALGTPFDPNRMRCVGERKGPPGVVLGVEQPGFLAKDTVLRPAGVLLAPPAAPR